VRLLTPGARTITCRPGLRLEAHGALERHTAAVDTLVVVGGMGSDAAAGDGAVVAHVRRLARDARRVASVCTGASVLAAAGLLDGRRATTHWGFAADLARAHPAVTVDPGPIFVRDGRIATSAGVTSALDLTLSFVAEDHGPALARRVARALVTYLQRPGTQAQMSVHLAAPAPTDDVVRRVVEHVAEHLADDLGAPVLAAVAGVSERHLTRLFRAELDRTPAEHVRRMRTEAAAHLVATTDVPLVRVASRCGFRSTETMRTAFLDTFGRTPSEHRRAFAVAS
jgi:transcriptional regulator GlxA family with amidase domain